MARQISRQGARQVAFLIDMNRCTGCKTCEIACKAEKKTPDGVRLRRVREFMVETPAATSYLSIACNHCEDPACVKACPVKAYTKRPDGIVVQNHAACIGCKACISACPYAAPVFNAAENKVSKCDFCVDRVDAGLAPRCAEACQNECLVAGELAALQAKHGKARTVKAFPSPVTTRPALVIKPTRAAKA